MLKKILCVLFILCAAVSYAAVQAERLQVESRTNPVGLDTAKPQFSWTMSDPDFTQGQKQTAYQIELRTGGVSPLWDSGKIISNQSTLVEYNGKPLQPSTVYSWKVCIWDKDGKATWSNEATFATGLFSADDWSGALWLKHPDAAENKTIWFRKTFTLNDVPKTALVHLASIGYHQLFINGKKADDRELAPPTLDYYKRIPSVSYDVSKLLQKGENVIAVWTAPGWASNKAFGPFNKSSCFRLKLLADKETVNSDTSWKCSESNLEGTEIIAQFGKNGGERLDARRDVPDWNKTGFDDSKWIVPKTLILTQPIASAVNVPPTRVIEQFKPLSITKVKEGYQVEFAKNFTGWVSANFRGLNAGDTVTIMTADDKATACDFNQRSYYIAAGKAEKENETFNYRFNYAAGRFITFTGLKEEPKLEDFTGFALGTDFEQTSSFKCSNPLYEKIFQLDLWTFRATTPEGFTMDCPHRERMGYGEVSTGTSWGIGIPNYDTAAFYRKIVQDWVDVQDPNGYVPHVAPIPEHQHWGGPLWSSAGLNVAYEHYINFGDKRILETAYPYAVKWLEFLNTNTKEGLLRPYQGPPKFLGDWLAPASRSEYGDKPPALYFNNCVYAWNLEEMIVLCEALGKTEDAARYQKRLTELKANIMKQFYKAETGAFMNGGQVQQSFALITGLGEDEKVKQRLVKAFDEKPYFDMGSSGLSPLLRCITSHPGEFGQTIAAFLNKTDYPSYGYFIKRGETTIPEDWNSECPSRIHTCYTGIASWFIKGFGGIRPDPDKPGYQSFIVQPVFPKEMDWAETSAQSPYGKITTNWKRSGSEIQLTVIVPPNSQAKIILPSQTQNAEAGRYTFVIKQ
jgi:alpha-L-rhamnosidase